MKTDENGQSTGGRVRWPPYDWIQNEADYSIFEDIWEAKYDQHDKDAYERYLRILGLSRQGLSGSAIEKLLATNNVRKYLSGTKRSFLTHLRAERERIGPPQAKTKWAPLRLKPRGTPDSRWIAVPPTISDFQEIVSVIEQREPTEESFSTAISFGYSSKEELLRDRVDMFGFVLGVMLGDASKPVKGTTRFPSMTVSLTLSKDKPNSFRFGEFTTLCNNASLGLSMHRIADAPSSTGRYTDAECYRWLSPASPLLGWVFRVCMGLKEGETTTYDLVRMDWIFDAPRDFRVSFLQGMAESDGWVDAGSDVVIFVSSPNDRFFGTLLTSLKISHRLYHQRHANIIAIPTESGLGLPIFSARIRSNNYEEMRTMATAKTFPSRRPLPDYFLTKIRPILLNTLTYNQMCLEIAEITGYKISSPSVKKYKQIATKLTDPPPPSFFLTKVVLSQPGIDQEMKGRKANESQDSPLVYASVWSKKTMRGNKVMIMRLLVVSPTGSVIYEDSDEKTVGYYPGRKSENKIKDLVKGHAEYSLTGIDITTDIPLANITLKDRVEIEEILSRTKSGIYDKIRDLR